MNEEDLLKYKALKGVIEKGDFQIKGEAIKTVASLLIWFDSLENKIQANISKPVLNDAIIKDIDSGI